MIENKYKSSFYNIYKSRNEEKEIFNSFTKANVIFTDTMFNSIKENRIEDIDAETIKELLKLGIIVPNNIDEFETIKENYIKYRNAKDTLLITLIPTFMCNFRCPYCFEGTDAKANQTIINYIMYLRNIRNIFCLFKYII